MRLEGVSKGRQGSVTAGSTPSTLTKVCVGSSSSSASVSTTSGTSPPAGPVWFPVIPPPPAWEETRVQDIAAGMDLIGGVGVPRPPPPLVTRRHDTRHKKTRSQIEPRRVPGGKQDNPCREAFNANHCIRQQTVFFCFLVVHQGSYSLSLCSRVLIHCHCHCQYHFPCH